MVTTVSVREAKTHLSRLLAQVEAGEDVVIARNGKPIARLVLCELVLCEPPGRREFGTLKGRIRLDEGFFAPLPEEEIAAWEGDQTS